MTAVQLAERMAAVGVPFDRNVLANLETGRRRFVTVQELLALAYTLDVAPVHLLVDPDDEEPYEVTPAGPRVPPGEARAWIRGTLPVGEQDVRGYGTHVPKEEFGPDRNGLMNTAVAEALLRKLLDNARDARGPDGR